MRIPVPWARRQDVARLSGELEQLKAALSAAGFLHELPQARARDELEPEAMQSPALPAISALEESAPPEILEPSFEGPADPEPPEAEV